MISVKEIATLSTGTVASTGESKGRRGSARLGTPPLLIALLAAGLLCLVPSEVVAECRVLRGSGESPGVLSLRLSGDCTDRDRETEAVTAGEILQALKEGRDVDLVNVLVTGDLRLDSLPTDSLERLWQSHPGLREALGEGTSGPVRTSSSRFSLQDSFVRGQITANPKPGYLVLVGPVTLTGTTFHRSVDFTRTVFIAPLEGSRATFAHEAFFIQARFLGDARFDESSFGVRARFHRSRFLGPAVFTAATFNGMAEFLEVAFERPVNFGGAQFRLAAGFSGSRFEGPLDFSDSLFRREAFFLYTVFRSGANFRRATFRGLADFSHAEFHGGEDFATAIFERQPRFSRSTSTSTGPPTGGGQDPRVLYGVAAVLLVLTVLLLWTRRWG